MGGVEQRVAVGHRRVGGDDPPDHVALKLRDGVAVHRRDPGEGVEIVVDQRLAGDRDHPAIGLDLVALLRLPKRAALELPALADFQQLRRLAELDTVHRLEVGGEHLTAEQHEGAGIGLVGLPQGLVGDGGQDLGEVRGRMQRARRHLVAREAARVHPGIAEAFTGQFQQGHAAILARGVLQLEQRRAVAVQQRVRHRVAAGDAFVPATQRDRDMGEGPGLVGFRGDLIEDQAAGLVHADAALDQILGEAALEVQTAGQVVDGGYNRPKEGCAEATDHCPASRQHHQVRPQDQTKFHSSSTDVLTMA